MEFPTLPVRVPFGEAVALQAQRAVEQAKERDASMRRLRIGVAAAQQGVHNSLNLRAD